jgi:hypothetical protein
MVSSNYVEGTLKPLVCRKTNPTPPQLVSSFSFIDETTITWKENSDASTILNIWAWKVKFFNLFG